MSLIKVKVIQYDSANESAIAALAVALYADGIAAGDNRYINGIVSGIVDEVKSVGSLDFSGQPADTDVITIYGVVFEFDNDSTTTSPNIPVTIDVDLPTTLGNLKTAIEANVAALGIISGSTLNLVSTSTGTAGDSSITATCSVLTPTGMSGGVNGVVGTYSSNGIYDGMIGYQSSGIYEAYVGYHATGIWEGMMGYQSSGIWDGFSHYGWFGSGIYDGGMYFGSGIYDGGMYYEWGILAGSGNNSGYHATGIWDGMTYNLSGIYDGNSYNYHSTGILSSYGWESTGIFDGYLMFVNGIYDGSARYDYGILYNNSLYYPSGILVGEGTTYSEWYGSGIYTSDGATYNSAGVFDGSTLYADGVFNGSARYGLSYAHVLSGGTLEASNIGTLTSTDNLVDTILKVGYTVDNVVGSLTSSGKPGFGGGLFAG